MGLLLSATDRLLGVLRSSFNSDLGMLSSYQRKPANNGADKGKCYREVKRLSQLYALRLIKVYVRLWRVE